MATDEIDQLKAGIAALEAQRAVLGDAVVDSALGPMRAKLTALEEQGRTDQQRKQATILFADVSGFTAMSESMDAEEVAEVMNDLWEAVDKAITEFGGLIDKHIGDAVMGLWGADTAREDDPERAVRAALAMQAAIGYFRDTRGASLAMRIGINTGPVVLGAIGTTGEFTAMGGAVNLASRLEHAAPVDGILISHDTYRHIRGIFDVVPQAPLPVKGKPEPVQVYVVMRAKPRAFRMATRGVEGVETRMVGRDVELNLLKDAYLDAFESAETRVITIVGEAGVGKSRLLYEFDNWVELRPERIFFFKGRSTPNTQNVPYSLFRDLFANRFNILDSDSIAVAMEKFRNGMAGVLEPDLADVVGHWLGFDFSSSPSVQRLLGGSRLMETARAFLVRYLRALADPSPFRRLLASIDDSSVDASNEESNEIGPTVIFLEDIHWADDQSLELAAYLAKAIPEAQLLIVAVARPRLFERQPNWDEGPSASRRILLTPLSKQASSALVNEILKRVEKIPDALRDLITDAAEGNPFYVEELVKMLIEQGVIERGGQEERGNESEHGSATALSTAVSPTDDVWQVRLDRLATLSIPPTLTALLQARLDGLPQAEREALQRASVVGRLFWDDAVAVLLEAEREKVAPTLEAVRRRELIFHRDSSAFAGAEEYIFKHALLRDVAYETVLLKRRAAYHQRAARWLEAIAGERRDEYLTLIAEHYIRAGDKLRAADLLQQSGMEALQVGSFSVARRALEQVLSLREAAGDTDSPAVTATLVGLGRALDQMGAFAAAEAAFERGLAGARAAGSRADEAEALLGLSSVATERGDFDLAWAFAEKALPLGRALGGRLHVLSERWAAAVLTDVGDLVAAEAHAQEALALSRIVGDVAGEIKSLNALGTIAANRRDLEQAKTIQINCLALARRANILSSEATALTNLGNTAYLLGDYLAARAFGWQAQERFQEMGLMPGVALAQGNLAQAELKLGDAAAARHGVLQAMRLAKSIGHQPHVFWLVFVIGQILAAEGDKARALALYGMARAHPALVDLDRVEIDEEVARLGLPANEVEAALAAGAALDFETVVEEILEGKW